MTPISSLSMQILGIFSCWHMLLFWATLCILVLGLWDNGRMHSALRNMLTLLLCVLNYTLFQCTVGFTSQNAVTVPMIRVVARYAQMPAIALFAVCVLLTITETYLILSMQHRYNTSITPASIKETIETLPVGLCAYEPGGKIVLKNTTMEQLCRKFLGGSLLNGNEFVQRLSEVNPTLTDMVLLSPNFSVWTFTKDEIRDESNCFTLLVAYNVTEAYEKTEILAQRRETLRELSGKLLNYNRQIEQLVMQQELLNAKIRIHDELGSGLLAIQRCLVAGGSDHERRELMERLKKNIRFLQQETTCEIREEYALILATAENLGVSVQVTGTLPQTEPNKHIVATAIHECFTNILRHTKGDTLFVSITEDARSIRVRFTDNNPRPINHITETGGLRTLRDLTEGAKGEMHITTAPCYCLTLILPKEAENHDPSCSDCG